MNTPTSQPDPRNPGMQPQEQDFQLTDPALDALLDELLAPAPATDDLNQRILAATAPIVRAQHQPVLARLGYKPALRSAAAVAVMATLTYLLWPQAQPITPETGPVASASFAQFDALDAAAAATQDRPITDLELKIDLLDMQVAMVGAADPWNDADHIIDGLALEEAFNLYAADLGELF